MTPNAVGPYKRKFLLYAVAGLVILTAALAVGGYAWHARSSFSSPAGHLEQVTIANTNYAGTCSVLVAQKEGYFRAQGLLVTIQPHTTGKAALNAVLQGQADLGTSADLPIMFAAMKKNRIPISVLATIFLTDKDYGIVGRKDRNINAPQDLKGKRIGVTLTTSGHFMLDAFLNRQKLSVSDVELRDLKPEQLPDALAKGDIDAASTWEPYLGTMREQLGNNAAFFSAEDIYDSVYNITGTQEYVTKHPETIKKVLRALIRGGEFCRDTPEDASQIVAKAVGTDIIKLKQLWPSYRFNVTLDQGLVLALEDEARWAIKNKLAEGPTVPNYLNDLYIDGLKSVSPTAVTLIH